MSNIENIKQQVGNSSDEEIWMLYAHLGLKLKERGLVRTRNIVGERGEFLAINFYNKTAGLPNLQAAPEGTQNVDALSRKGERYSVKTVSLPGSTTGVFYGLGNKDDPEPSEKKFEYVIIVVIDSNLQLERMLEVDWGTFLKFRRWHSTMRAWNLSVTKDLVRSSRIIFTANVPIAQE